MSTTRCNIKNTEYFRRFYSYVFLIFTVNNEHFCKKTPLAVALMGKKVMHKMYKIRATYI